MRQLVFRAILGTAGRIVRTVDVVLIVERISRGKICLWRLLMGVEHFWEEGVTTLIETGSFERVVKGEIDFL